MGSFDSWKSEYAVFKKREAEIGWGEMNAKERVKYFSDIAETARNDPEKYKIERSVDVAALLADIAYITTKKNLLQET